MTAPASGKRAMAPHIKTKGPLDDERPSVS
jgi:hypothetical protein